MRSSLVAITFALVAGLAVLAVQHKDPKNLITCTICKDVIQIVDEALVDNATIAEIEALLDVFCDLLPGLEQPCKDFVAEQLPIIIDLLVIEYLNPEEVCISLFQCP